MLENSNPGGSCEFCNQPAVQKCSGCHSVFYCCQEHQKSHWTTHKDQCRPYEIQHSEQLGRHLKASRELKKGDLIFSEFPLVSGPNPHWNGEVLCVGCSKILQEIKETCLECHWPVCDLDCEGLTNNAKHGVECRVLKVKTTPFRFDVLVILRCLFLQKTNQSKWEQVMDLEAHLEHRGPRSDVFKFVEEKVDFLKENFLGAMPEDIDCSPRIVRKIYAILDVNATEITEDFLLVLLYPITSLIEHNCTPNTYQIIDRQSQKITFKSAVEIQAGGNISWSYTNILWGTFQRQQHLKISKYFLCQCKRCADPTELGSYLSCLKCLCGGLQLPQDPLDEKTCWKCDKCGITLPQLELMQFVDHLGGEVEKILLQKPTRSQLQEVLGKMLRFLHPNHFHVYQIKHTLIQLLENNEETLEMCNELIEITKKIDPGTSRMSLYLGVIFNEVFKTQKKCGKSEELRDILKQGLEVLEKEVQSRKGLQLKELLEKNLDSIE